MIRPCQSKFSTRTLCEFDRSFWTNIKLRNGWATLYSLLVVGNRNTTTYFWNIVKTSALPFSQSLPWYPLRQKHSKLPGLLKQLPPFLQGILMHSLTSQRKNSNNKKKNISSLRYPFLIGISRISLEVFVWSMRTVSADSCQLKTPYVKSVCFDLCKYHNGTSIRMSWGTGSLRVASQGLSRAFFKTFAAVLPDPTDRPWVSEDANLLVSRQTFVINTKPNKYHDSYLSCTHSELRKSNTYELLKIVQNLFLRHRFETSLQASL